ncbi:mechanosensitive ion channel family protein [uncultured Lutibacter sp.]|uniref:mechanosensitive ion channel family protein n=1 Tax=uncultured Lutibacter sp. TaxID=437739 RepID=UPI00261E4F00|nr:mechanosensitive ion channel family protein [uncultured Lutibacter sp.]
MKEYFAEWTEFLIPWLLSSGLRILVIIIVTFIINKVITRLIDKMVRLAVVPNNHSSEEAEKKREDTLIQIFSITAKIGIFSILILMVFQEFGVEIGPILAAAGIVGLAFGFGGQYLIRDIISGLFIILENQYRIGDYVKFENLGGVVEKISLRMTTLRDLDGTVHHIPHGEIKEVSNYAKDFARVNLDIGIAYNANLEHVIGVVNEVGNELAQDIQFKEFIIKAPQFLRVNDFADSSVMLKILGETLPLKQWEITGELRKRLKIAFDREGIEIPFPQRVIHQS